MPPRKFCMKFLERHFANSVGNLIDTCPSFCSATQQTRFAFCAGNHIRLSALSGSAPWPQPPSPSPPVGVTGATIWKIGHERRQACASPRGEGRFSAFRCGGDRNHADREFTFADLVLNTRTWLIQHLMQCKSRVIPCVASVVFFLATSSRSR